MNRRCASLRQAQRTSGSRDGIPRIIDTRYAVAQMSQHSNILRLAERDTPGNRRFTSSVCRRRELIRPRSQHIPVRNSGTGTIATIGAVGWLTFYMAVTVATVASDLLDVKLHRGDSSPITGANVRIVGDGLECCACRTLYHCTIAWYCDLDE